MPYIGFPQKAFNRTGNSREFYGESQDTHYSIHNKLILITREKDYIKEQIPFSTLLSCHTAPSRGLVFQPVII